MNIGVHTWFVCVMFGLKNPTFFYQFKILGAVLEPLCDAIEPAAPSALAQEGTLVPSPVPPFS